MKVSKKNKKSAIEKYILDYIKENNLGSGDKLPTQAELVEILNFSRTAIRETVKELEGKNIIKVINGKGMFVQEQDGTHLLSGLDLEKKKESVIDVLESRWAIETEILRNIIANVTDAELKPIGEIVQSLMSKYNQNELQNNLDKQFHYALYECCRNKVLKELIISLGYLTDELWDFPLGINNPFVETIPLHKKMFEAIVRRDFFKAKHYNDASFIMMIEEIESFHRMK